MQHLHGCVRMFRVLIYAVYKSKASLPTTFWPMQILTAENFYSSVLSISLTWFFLTSHFISFILSKAWFSCSNLVQQHSHAILGAVPAGVLNLGSFTGMGPTQTSQEQISLSKSKLRATATSLSFISSSSLLSESSQPSSPYCWQEEKQVLKSLDKLNYWCFKKMF